MIESYLARLKEIEGYSVKSVILFGSVARGQAKEHSDIDIIVVASGLPELKRRDVLPPFRKPARIQDIWMTPEELEDMVKPRRDSWWMPSWRGECCGMMGPWLGLGKSW